LGERPQLVNGQIVLAIEVAPIKTVLAGLVADGVNEEDQEGRRGPISNPLADTVIP
jgi:hypothetical protein